MPAPLTEEELKQRKAYRARAAAKQTAKHKKNSEKRKAEAKKSGIPTNCQISLSSDAVLKWLKKDEYGCSKWLDRSDAAKALAKSGKARCTYPGGCVTSAPFNLSKQGLREHSMSKCHIDHIAAVAGAAAGEHEHAFDAHVFKASAAGNDDPERIAMYTETVRNVRHYAIGQWVASGMNPYQWDSVMTPLAPALKICSHLGSDTQARTVVLPGLFEEIRRDLKDLMSKTPAITLVIDGGDAAFGDGHTGKMGVYDIYAESACLLEPCLLETIVVRSGVKR